MPVTVTPTVEPSTGPDDPPRISLAVAATDATTPVTVLRLEPDGTQTVVRTTDGAPLPLSGGAGLVFDYEAPFGAPVAYTTAEDPATVSAQVTVDEPAVWLIDPGVPALSRPVQVVTMSDRSRDVAQGVFRPMGRRNAIVHTDGQRQSPEYTLTVRTPDLPALDALLGLLDGAGTLLLNVPAGKGWGVEAEYVAVGKLTEARRATYGSRPDRDWQLPCVVTDRPAGGTQAERTYADLLTFASYAQLRAAYPTYLALLTGP